MAFQIILMIQEKRLGTFDSITTFLVSSSFLSFFKFSFAFFIFRRFLFRRSTHLRRAKQEDVLQSGFAFFGVQEVHDVCRLFFLRPKRVLVFSGVLFKRVLAKIKGYLRGGPSRGLRRRPRVRLVSVIAATSSASIVDANFDTLSRSSDLEKECDSNSP